MNETESMSIFVWNGVDKTLRVFRSDEQDARALAAACIDRDFDVIYFYANVDDVILDLKE